MARIPSPVGEAHPTPRAPVLADLAPAEATRVTVCHDKTARGIVRKISDGIEHFQFVDPVTAGTGRRPGGVMWVLTVDMDHDDSLLRIFAADVPQPSWIIEKGRNGHVQAGWIIEHVTVGPNARPAPIAFAEDVRAALTSAVGGDPAFTNRRQWNPTWTGWATEGRVIWGPTAPRSLGALRAEMIENHTWPTLEAPVSTAARRDTNTARALVSAAEASMTVEQGERNQFVFDYARLRRTGTVAQAAAHANSLCAPPLPAAEVAGIIRSIERYEARQRTRNGLRGRGHGHLSDAYRRRQAERGRIGGSRGTAAQRAQRVTAAQRAAHVRAQKAAARAAEAHQQAADGATTAQIAERMGVTARTVRTWLNQPPAQRKSSERQGALARPSRHHPSPALAPVRSGVQRLPSASGTRYPVGGRKRCPHDADPDPPDHLRRGHRAARTAPGHPDRT
ncbi:replication initiation protein [Micrococcus luteus]|uniref:replication initiation protein n=1 Tax=Micrococcus luteus TaxID=1270 RepID=UPI001C8DC022|nr:replication initiation protein [Micrococcus luteus]MBY0170646.1 replication initiation protein [Micrococcus luteus]